MESSQNAVDKTTAQTSEAGQLAVEELASRLARETPSLANLSHDELEAVARVVMGQRLVRDLDRKVDLAGIDYPSERDSFIAQAGRTKSVHTQRAYASAIDRLETFASRRGIQILAMLARDADDFAYALAAEGRAPASVRRDIAAASSLFTFLERRFETVRNPFRGTKARPEKKTRKPVAYPTEEEALAIITALSLEARVAVAVMLYRGLRVGALPSLTIIGNRFIARSKGKEISGTLSSEVLATIKTSGLDNRSPFAETSATKLADAIRKKTAKLAKNDEITAAYSAHDFRHLFAITEYRRDRDIYRVSKLLGHASIQVTENYLQGLGEVD